MSANGVTQEQLARAFREIGLKPGDSLIVHSSLRSLGYVEGGPDAVLDALLDSIGPTGNLMLPTFNYVLPPSATYFDPATTPCHTGIIPETARKRPEAIRSLHPTHSVVVIGPNAEELTQGHLLVRTFGIDSPLDRLARRGGKVLLLGVGHTACSMIHVAEEHAGIPKGSWFDELPIMKVRLPNGTFLTHQRDTSPSCSAAFGGAEGFLRRHEEIRDCRLSGCLMQLMRGADIIQRVCQAIQEKPDVLLCTWPGCKPCREAREALCKSGRLAV
jgi:aminoglycoside 3-N-acetyltransferase